MTSVEGRLRRRGVAGAVALLLAVGALIGAAGFGMAVSAGGSGAGGRGAPAPESTASPTPLGASAPVRIAIPHIGVHERLVKLGPRRHGRAIELPKDPHRAGWYTRSVTPGEAGPAIIIGYIDAGRHGPGVFRQLGRLHKGQQVRLTRKDGLVAVYRVDRIASYRPNRLPVRKVYGQVSYPALRIITCGGSLHGGSRPTNVVVYGHLATVRSADH